MPGPLLDGPEDAPLDYQTRRQVLAELRSRIEGGGDALGGLPIRAGLLTLVCSFPVVPPYGWQRREESWLTLEALTSYKSLGHISVGDGDEVVVHADLSPERRIPKLTAQQPD